MEDRVAKVTVRVVLPKVGPVVEKLFGPLTVAVMVVAPMDTVVARPVPSIVATDGLDEVQVTCGVISWFV